MTQTLSQYTERLEELARDAGLDYFPVEFEEVPESFMMEVSVYGLPVRMPHWSFGVRYIHQLVQHRMGHSRLFEVVFPGNPGRAYLARRNSLQENTLVAAHVLGHADFAKNNLLFRHSQEQVGYHIVEQAAAHAHQITEAMERHGVARVESVLDAALSLEPFIDIDKGLCRGLYAVDARPAAQDRRQDHEDPFRTRFDTLTGAEGRPERKPEVTPGVPPHPEYDLLWFIAHYAPDLEDWERDIFLVVREESFYFYPLFACQIMNEGWASYWHARLLRDADFLPSELYLDAIKAHSDVVRPYAGDRQVSLSVNPYHLGFSMWEKLIESHGLDEARTIMEQNDDFGFIRNYLSKELASELDLFAFTASRNGEVRVEESDVYALREQVLSSKYNFGSPRVCVSEMRDDGRLELLHRHEVDGRGLDLASAEKVLEYIHRVWRRPVVLHTVDENCDPRKIVKRGRVGG